MEVRSQNSNSRKESRDHIIETLVNAESYQIPKQALEAYKTLEVLRKLSVWAMRTTLVESGVSKEAAQKEAWKLGEQVVHEVGQYLLEAVNRLTNR